jgi:uncharacterized membrane protein
VLKRLGPGRLAFPDDTATTDFVEDDMEYGVVFGGSPGARVFHCFKDNYRHLDYGLEGRSGEQIATFYSKWSPVASNGSTEVPQNRGTSSCAQGVTTRHTVILSNQYTLVTFPPP